MTLNLNIVIAFKSLLKNVSKQGWRNIVKPKKFEKNLDDMPKKIVGFDLTWVEVKARSVNLCFKIRYISHLKGLHNYLKKKYIDKERIVETM